MAKTAKLFEKAIKLYQNGDLKGAKTQCLRAQKTSRTFPQAYFLMGCIARDEGNSRYAVTQFKKAIAINSDPYQFHLNLSFAYKDLGGMDESLASMIFASENVDTPESAGMIAYNIGCLQIDLGMRTDALLALQKAIKFNPNMIDAHNQLGVALLQTNRNDEAIESFQRALSIDEKFPPAYRNLGVAYMKMGKQEYALRALNRHLQLSGPDASVRHMIDALSGKQSEKAPDEYVEKLFDGFAGHFEEHLVDDLGYDIPVKMVRLLESFELPVPMDSHRVLDLGCGTGLVGDLLAPITHMIDGVDLSQLMLNKAEEKGIYHQLVKDEVVHFIRSSSVIDRYSLLVAAEVLIYLGDLDPLFNAIKESDLFSAQAIFVFSLEILIGESYFLQTSGRYSHSETYVEYLCDRYKFNVITKEATVIRKERGQDVRGIVYVVQLNF